MGIKYNLVCYLIYITIAAYGLGFLVSVVRQKKLGLVLYYLGFLPAVIAFGYRWHEVKYIPLQNMFEVFLCLGMLLPPISLFSRLVLRVGGEYVDMLIGIIILIPPGFVKGHFFSFEFHPLPPLLQSWIFSPHVGVYMLSYVLMAKAAVPAVAQLVKAEITTEKISTPFYLGSFLLAGIVPLFFLFQHLEGFALSPYYILTLYIASTLLILYGVTLFMILWYKAWHAIQDDQTRATPDKAVGFTLIPVYNIYWIFQLIGGFAKDYNSFVRRRKMTAKNLPIGYLRIYALLTLLYGILLILEVIFLIWDKTFLTYLHVIFIFGMIVLLFTLLVVHRICEAVRVLQPERISLQA